MSRNWNGDRSRLVQIAADLIERGYDAGTVCARMAYDKYRGADPERAALLLARDARRLAEERKRERARERYDEVMRMADTLEEEGWRYLPAVGGRPGGHWYHDRWGSVNRQGGPFGSFEEATRRTFDSVTREMCLEALEANEEKA